LEWLVCLIIIGILLSLATSVFRGAEESSVMARARNAVITYAQVARDYAVANHIETMLVANPYNGRFEVWYSNPPPDGGRWDPLPSTPAGTADPSNIDSYAFAPILDPAACLPLTPGGEPAAAVNPIDYATRPVSAVTDGPEMDNLTWAVFCFDESGQLVVRTRRIATRSFTLRDGTQRPAADRNRLLDETPDLTVSPLVSEKDTPITSTRGFVISDRTKLKSAMTIWPPTPAQLVSGWLNGTRAGGNYYMFARMVVLNRFSGQQLTSGAP
jgi:type II secretory pathway pseudopilin PulG